MPADLSRHPHFSAWTEPSSGLVSHILTERVAPIQQTLYYTNPSVSVDERWLWFTCAFPPNPGKTLGVCSLDPTRPLIRHFPHAGPVGASTLVAPEGDAAFFALDDAVWRVDVDGRVERLCWLPASYLAGRHLWRLATHLTLSADGRHFLLDGHAGATWFVALAPRAGGEATVIGEFQANHNHGQFSPVDPALFLIAHDQHRDAISGRFVHHRLRVHVMDTAGARYECLTPDRPARPYHGPCHEWWMADGTVAYIDYDTGVWRVDPARPREHVHLWREPLCHAHSDRSGRWLCADQSPYSWNERPCQVLLYEIATGRRLAIDAAMPAPPHDRGRYHLDPHPQFSPQGSWVCYTTMRRGRVDVALCPLPA